MMVSLVLRNVSRNLPRLRPMIIALAATVAVLLLGNSISEAVSTGYREVFTENITGHLTISSASERSFTVFGSEALIMGEFLVPPVLLEYDQLQRIVNRVPAVQRTAGLVTVAARVEIAGKGEGQLLFGVDFAEYAALFPRLRLLRGSFPAPGHPGVLIHQERFDEIARLQGKEPALGSPLLLSVFNNYSFTIREVPLAGVFTYPISDPVLNRVGLVDVQTARVLNGYVYGGGGPEKTPAAPAAGELDDLFAVPDQLVPATGSLDPNEIERRLRSEQTTRTKALEARQGAWNFLLIRLAESTEKATAGRILQALQSESYPETAQVQVRDWRHSAGGSALLVWIVQILLNAGLIFIAAGAAIVAVNALALSVLERTREIGTMRAIGARKGSIGIMIFAETLIIVTGAGLLGSATGLALVWLVNLLRIPLANPVLQTLFGSARLAGQVSAALVADHVLLSLVLGLAATLHPLLKCLRIIPARAMAAP